MIRRLMAQALASHFIRHATLLTGATVLANLITLLMLPVFSRMFSPESFGLQSLLIMGTMVLGNLTTGYYDWAIPTPKSKTDARELATLAFALAALMGIAGFVLLHFFSERFLATLGIPELRGWVFMLPPLGFALACSNVGNYWLLRAGNIAGLSSIRFVLPVTNAALSLILGLKHVELGLVYGFIAGVFASGVWGLFIARRSGLTFAFDKPRDHYRKLARRFSEFPLYGSIPGAAMILAGQLPLIVLTRAYALDVTGHYAVVRSVLFGSMQMIAMACGQIILKHIAEYKHRGEKVWPHYLAMLGLLAGAGVIGGIIVWSVSPYFFHLYLGPAWSDAGSIARMMAFLMPLWLMGISLATAPMALKRLKPIAIWQVCYGIAACCLFLLPKMPFPDLLARILLFEGCAYLLYIATATITVHRHGR